MLRGGRRTFEDPELDVHEEMVECRGECGRLVEESKELCDRCYAREKYGYDCEM